MHSYELFDEEDSRQQIDPDYALKAGWARRGYDPVVLQGAIPWRLKSQEMRTHNFLLHGFYPLEPFLRVHDRKKEPGAYAVSFRYALDWINWNNRRGKDAEGMAWNDMAVAMRAYRLGYILDAGLEGKLINDYEQEKIWDSLIDHARWLENDANIAFHNNHGFYQICAQLCIARRFKKNSEIMRAAGAQALRRLEWILHRQFDADGVHKEHSPDYHRMVYQSLRGIIRARLINDPEILDFAAKIEDSLAWFIAPDRFIVNFGDSDNRDMTETPKAAEAKWSTPHMRYRVAKGGAGAAPLANIKCFWKGGYWIVNTRTNQDDERASFLALNAAFHSRTHKHADDLTIVWHDHGSRILIDAGRYGYIGQTPNDSPLRMQGYWYSDPWRRYCESTAAHNTVEFDGRDLPRVGVTPYGSALVSHGHTDGGLAHVHASALHYGSLRHDRMIFYMPSRWLLLLDSFLDMDGESHDARQWLHFDPALELSPKAGGLDSEIGDQALRVRQLLHGAAPSELVYGREKPVAQGWWSQSERRVEPASAFHFLQEKKSFGAFATIFSFSSELDREDSDFDPSARKGALRWRDENGAYALELNRGDIALPRLSIRRVS